MRTAAVLFTALAALTLLAPTGGAQGLVTYRVRVFNLSSGQPLSPPVAATHRPEVHLFQVGSLASPEVEAIAEDGNQAPLVALLSGQAGVTQVFDFEAPLTPIGKTVDTFTPSRTFTIQAAAGDRFSFVTMLICTNDGIVGLDGVALPDRGLRAYLANGYDAGTEDNTQDSLHIVDPCSALGPVALPGDPDGNDNAGPETVPHRAIRRHPGITNTGELMPAVHGWIDPVVLVIIERL